MSYLAKDGRLYPYKETPAQYSRRRGSNDTHGGGSLPAGGDSGAGMISTLLRVGLVILAVWLVYKIVIFIITHIIAITAILAGVAMLLAAWRFRTPILIFCVNLLIGVSLISTKLLMAIQRKLTDGRPPANKQTERGGWQDV